MNEWFDAKGFTDYFRYKSGSADRDRIYDDFNNIFFDYGKIGLGTAKNSWVKSVLSEHKKEIKTRLLGCGYSPVLVNSFLKEISYWIKVNS